MASRNPEIRQRIADTQRARYLETLTDISATALAAVRDSLAVNSSMDTWRAIGAMETAVRKALSRGKALPELAAAIEAFARDQPLARKPARPALGETFGALRFAHVTVNFEPLKVHVTSEDGTVTIARDSANRRRFRRWVTEHREALEGMTLHDVACELREFGVDHVVCGGKSAKVA